MILILFLQSVIFLIYIAKERVFKDGINGQRKHEDLREKSEKSDVDLLGDIRFTSTQAATLAKKGVFPPERFIDKNPSLMFSERKGSARDADDTVKKWNDYFDEFSGYYQVPWIFSPSYPPEWQPLVRAALVEFEKSTCVKAIEISSAEVKIYKIRINH